MYYLQAILLATASIFFAQRKGRLSGLIAATIFIWLVGVSLIYWRYGPIGQWSFYQNDQYFHWRLVDYFIPTEFNLTFDRLNFLRLPYAGPAFLLSQVGIDPTLALKFVSLTCALGNFGLLERFLQNNSQTKVTTLALWMFAGPITIFFSVLALRETMMILCVTYLFLGSSHFYKSVSLLALVVLRPHLAAAIVFGLCWSWLLRKVPIRLHLISVIDCNNPDLCGYRRVFDRKLRDLQTPASPLRRSISKRPSNSNLFCIPWAAILNSGIPDRRIFDAIDSVNTVNLPGNCLYPTSLFY